jgi:hypothetical protein
MIGRDFRVLDEGDEFLGIAHEFAKRFEPPFWRA